MQASRRPEASNYFRELRCPYRYQRGTRNSEDLLRSVQPVIEKDHALETNLTENLNERLSRFLLLVALHAFIQRFTV